jgi:hypothetical protein
LIAQLLKTSLKQTGHGGVTAPQVLGDLRK